MLFLFLSCVGLLSFLILQCLSVAIVISCHIVLGDVLLLILLIIMLSKMRADVESDHEYCRVHFPCVYLVDL